MILKSKNEEVLAKMRAKKPRQEKNQKGNIELPIVVKHTMSLLIPYINETRLRNVLSKHIDYIKKDFNKIYTEFREEIYQDFEEDNQELYLLEDKERKMVDKEVGRLCIDIWRPIFLSEVI